MPVRTVGVTLSDAGVQQLEFIGRRHDGCVVSRWMPGMCAGQGRANALHIYMWVLPMELRLLGGMVLVGVCLCAVQAAGRPWPLLPACCA